MPVKEPDYDYKWVKFKETFDWREAWSYKESSDYRVKEKTVYVNEKDYVVKITYNPLDLISYRYKREYIIEKKTEAVEACPGKYFFSKKDAEDFAEKLHKATSIPTEVKSKWKWCTWTETEEHYFSYTVLKVSGNTVTFYNPDGVSQKYIVIVKEANVNNIPLMSTAKSFTLKVPARGTEAINVYIFSRNVKSSKIIISVKTWCEVASFTITPSIIKLASIEDVIGPVNWREFFITLAADLGTTLFFVGLYKTNPLLGMIITNSIVIKNALYTYNAYTEQIKVLRELGFFGVAAQLETEKVAAIIEATTGVPAFSVMVLMHGSKATPEDRGRALAHIVVSLPITCMAVKNTIKRIIDESPRFKSIEVSDKIRSAIEEYSRKKIKTLGGVTAEKRVENIYSVLEEYPILNEIPAEVKAGRRGIEFILTNNIKLWIDAFEKKLKITISNSANKVSLIKWFKDKGILVIEHAKERKRQTLLYFSGNKWETIEGHVFFSENNKLKTVFLGKLADKKLTVKIKDFCVKDNKLKYSVELSIRGFTIKYIEGSEIGEAKAVHSTIGWGLKINNIIVYENGEVRLKVDSHTYLPRRVITVSVKGRKIFVVEFREGRHCEYVAFSPLEEVSYGKIIENLGNVYDSVINSMVKTIENNWESVKGTTYTVYLNGIQFNEDSPNISVIGAIAELLAASTEKGSVHGINPDQYVNIKEKTITLSKGIIDKFLNKNEPDIIKGNTIIEVKGVTTLSSALTEVEEAKTQLMQKVFWKDKFYDKVAIIIYKIVIEKVDKEQNAIIVRVTKLVKRSFTFDHNNCEWISEG